MSKPKDFSNYINCPACGSLVDENKCREFYVWPKRKGEFFGSILSIEDFEQAINPHCKETAFRAIEYSPLIAAAPEMLELLKMVSDVLDEYPSSTEVTRNFEKKVFNVIKKVTGEPQEEPENDNESWIHDPDKGY